VECPTNDVIGPAWRRTNIDQRNRELRQKFRRRQKNFAARGFICATFRRAIAMSISSHLRTLQRTTRAKLSLSARGALRAMQQR
jgi:hypothetical protein